MSDDSPNLIDILAIGLLIYMFIYIAQEVLPLVAETSLGQQVIANSTDIILFFAVAVLTWAIMTFIATRGDG